MEFKDLRVIKVTKIAFEVSKGKQKIQFVIYFHRKMRLFLIVWYLFQSRF